MRYKDESMNDLHEELAKTAVISTDFKWAIERMANSALQQAYLRGREDEKLCGLRQEESSSIVLIEAT